MMESCTGGLCFSPLLIGKIAGAAFFAILFLQSGLDKLNDWAGNLNWIKGYFEKSLFKNYVFPLLSVLTLLEVSAGLFCLTGIITIFTCNCMTYLTFGLGLSGLSLLSLFLGMRIAKDYSAAASIAAYFAAWTGWAIIMSL